MPRFVYSPDYYCDIGAHVFPTCKYAMLHDLMIAEDLVAEGDFAEPQPAGRADLELVHTAEYVDDLMAARMTRRTQRSEMPISPQIVRAFVLGAGGSMLAARLALENATLTMNLAGGFHHAFPDWAEGFCYVNDVAVAVQRVRRDGLAERVMVVDCDLHQGNGTAYIFRHVPEVFTFSIHQENLYPVKQCSDLDIGLPDFCDGRRYIAELERGLNDAFAEHESQFVIYLAGADPYERDVLGALRLSMADLRERDELVLGACARRGVPAATVLAGGYAMQVADTVRIHCNTAAVIVEMGGYGC